MCCPITYVTETLNDKCFSFKAFVIFFCPKFNGQKHTVTSGTVTTFQTSTANGLSCNYVLVFRAFAGTFCTHIRICNPSHGLVIGVYVWGGNIVFWAYVFAQSISKSTCNSFQFTF